MISFTDEAQYYDYNVNFISIRLDLLYMYENVKVAKPNGYKTYWKANLDKGLRFFLILREEEKTTSLDLITY